MAAAHCHGTEGGVDCSREELEALIAGGEVARRIVQFMFGVPDSQEGTTLRARNLVRVRTECKLA
jgi:hypothetical protein